MRKRIFIIISYILFLISLVVAGVVVFGQLSGRKLISLFIVASGSMEPAIKTGSLVINTSEINYQIGDIVTYLQGTDKKNTVTHRIVWIGENKFRTAGDANNRMDSNLFDKQQIIGKVKWVIPYAGYAAAFAKTPKGFILLVIIPATIIVYEEIRSVKKELEKLLGRIKPAKHHSLLRNSVIIPVIGAGIILSGWSGAYFRDDEVSANNSFTAADFIVPTVTTSPTNHIVISEVQIIEGGKANHDFVELYNPTSNAINLHGYRLVSRTPTSNSDNPIKSWSTNDQIIAAHGYYLWASSSDANYPAYILADTWTQENISDNGSVAIRYGALNTGQIIDAVCWGIGTTIGEGTSFNINPADGQSLERKAFWNSTAVTMTSGSDLLKGNGFDSENNANDFILRMSSQPQNSTSPTELP